MIKWKTKCPFSTANGQKDPHITYISKGSKGNQKRKKKKSKDKTWFKEVTFLLGTKSSRKKEAVTFKAKSSFILKTSPSEQKPSYPYSKAVQTEPNRHKPLQENRRHQALNFLTCAHHYYYHYYSHCYTHHLPSRWTRWKT